MRASAGSRKSSAAIATQITSLLRDHYLPIRDFSRHETDQKEDIREIKALIGTLHRGQDELRDPADREAEMNAAVLIVDDNIDLRAVFTARL